MSDMAPLIDDEPDYRFTLANERTFLAWQRMALGLCAATVALLQLVPEPTERGLYYLLPTGLGLLAILSASGGLMRWRHVDRAIRRHDVLPHSRTPALLASGLLILGLVVSTTALLKTPGA
jgi:putative membrane protein